MLKIYNIRNQDWEIRTDVPFAQTALICKKSKKTIHFADLTTEEQQSVMSTVDDFKNNRGLIAAQ